MSGCRIAAAVALLVLLAMGCRNTQRAAMTESEGVPRPAWAEPVPLAGLPNLHQVNEQLYRGAQPTREGLLELQKLGVKTIVNLRSRDSDRRILRGLDLEYLWRPMSPWQPRDEDVAWFLGLTMDESRGPIFVHCEHGADRCGLMLAMHRIVIQGWRREAAIAEMTRGGMGFHSAYGNLVEYVRRADVKRIRSLIELSAGAP